MIKYPSYKSTARLLVSQHPDLVQQYHHNTPIRQYYCTTVDVMQPPFDIVSMLSRWCCHYACWLWLTGKHKTEKNLDNLRNKNSAPTKFANIKYFVKQGHHDAKRARASPCKVQTYNRSKNQQEAATLCSITSSTVAAVALSYVW